MTLYDALNFHQYQTISSVILSEAEEAIQLQGYSGEKEERCIADLE